MVTLVSTYHNNQILVQVFEKVYENGKLKKIKSNWSQRLLKNMGGVDSFDQFASY